MYVPRNQLPIPKVCDNCKSDRVGLSSNSVVYGDEVGVWPYCYYCDECTAMTGCHPNTHNPLGLMATGATRRRRGILHALFDPIWHRNYMSREAAYNWLGKELGIEEECHISILTKEQLKQAHDILLAHKNNDYALFKRRKEKSDAKRYARSDRQSVKISIRKNRYKSK